jgi:Lon protease-like protein
MKTELAIFPLPLVLLPGEYLPLRIFEARYLDMVANCLRVEEPFVLSPILKKNQTEKHLTAIGTTANIVEWDKREDTTLHIIIKGSQKVLIDQPTSKNNGLIVAETTFINDFDSELSEEEFGFLKKSLETNGLHDLLKATAGSKSATEIAYEIASLLYLNPIERYSILREDTGAKKLSLVEKYLSNYVNPDKSTTLH